MKPLPTNKVFVFDIETNSSKIEKAELRYFGGYSYITNKRYYFKGDSDTVIQSIKQIIAAHDVFVGFNQKGFDIPVLNKYNIYFQYKVQVDLYEALSDPKLIKTKHGNERKGGKGRGQYMGLKLNSWSLANIVKTLELGEYKLDFDYKILEKKPEEWTPEEIALIEEYLAQDITITKNLFEYTHEFFAGFIDMLPQKNILKFNYINSSVASLGYQVVCHLSNLPETYGEGYAEEGVKGGYVKTPTVEKCIGEIRCYDFNSLYPSIFRGFNLFSPVTPDYSGPVFSGNDFFKISGKYKADKLGVIEQTVADIYGLRKQLKKEGDKREYLYKIVLNSLYGDTFLPVFAQLYSRHAGGDCTRIGRTMTKYAGEYFDKQGYKTLYSDTDSVYVYLNGKTTDEADKTARELEEFFLSKMPLPHDDFGFGLDYEIKTMFFFKDEDKNELKKKNYVFITKDDKLKIKGLPIIKSNASQIAVKILKEHLKPQILAKKEIKFAEGYLKQLIYYELEKDISLATQVYKVKDVEEYAIEGSIQAQIAKKYRTNDNNGVVTLIPINPDKGQTLSFGVGKNKRYVTPEEFKEHGLTVQDIDLTTTMKNLLPFTFNPQQTLF